MSGTPVVLYLMGAIALHGLLALGLNRWGRWVADRRAGHTWRRAAWMPLVAFGLTVVGVATSVVFLMRAFSAVEGADASQKATLLAQNISYAMNCTALFAVPAWLLYVGSLVVCAVGTLRAIKDDPEL